MRNELMQIDPSGAGVWRLGRMWMGLLAFAGLTLMTTAWCEDDTPPSESKVIKQLKEIYRTDAGEYSIYRDAALREKLELRDEPVYIWTNVLRDQSGSVFVWTWHGRPEAIGSIFSQPESGGNRQFIHELHSLSTSTLAPQRASPNRWEPKAGLARISVPGAPKPADTSRQRLIQMRDLSNQFTARSKSVEQQTWELRLLTQPLFRYQSTDREIIDGALFAFVTSAGTDPEVVLVLEASTTGSAEPIWTYAICRFSDHNLYVAHREKEIWSSVRSETDTVRNDAKHLYRLYIDRSVKDILSESKSR